jgi:O-glycosyl hydrolase
MRRVKPFLLAGVLCVTASVSAATVTVDLSETHQTIEGLAIDIPSHRLQEHDDAELLGRLVDGVGMSMLRIYPEWAFENPNDNGDPLVLDKAALDYEGDNGVDGPMIALQYGIVSMLKEHGMDRVILSVFSPPPWMKTNNSPTDGGSLLEDMYEEYAEYYVAYVRAIKEKTGVDVYAISPENEPRWGQFYDSCIFTPEQMRDTVKALGKRFKAEGIDVKIFAAEDLMGADWAEWGQPWTEYQAAIMADPEAPRYLDALAIHTYVDGVEPSSPTAEMWAEAAAAAREAGIPVWMTETSGYGEWWSIRREGRRGRQRRRRGALALANGIFSALKYGECAVWSQLSPLRRGTYPPKCRAVARQFYRFIRPGAVQIGASSDDEGVVAMAFKHQADGTQTLVLLNHTEEPRDVTLQGTGGTSFRVFRTSETENCAEAGTVTDALALPPQSLTTLYTGEAPADPAADAAAPPGP